MYTLVYHFSCHLQQKPRHLKYRGYNFSNINSAIIASSFSHPDFTVGSGISPDRLTIAYTISVHRFLTRYPPNDQFADFTAGWELHPAPKNLSYLYLIIILWSVLFKAFFKNCLIGRTSSDRPDVLSRLVLHKSCLQHLLS